MTSYPAPGRGAWTITGGLLPAKPGSTSRSGYYRLAGLGEIFVGAGWSTGADTSHHAQCVWLGTTAIQDLIGMAPSDQDGWFGPDTDQYVRAAQSALRVEVDGIIGRDTMRAVLTPLINAHALSIPVRILGGLLLNESGLDPAAVGSNGTDHGVAQINLAAHPEISLTDAMHPEFAIAWTSQELLSNYQRLGPRCVRGVDPWNVAIAAHNSPTLARQWATTGSAPVVPGRPFQIAEYVQRVKTVW